MSTPLGGTAKKKRKGDSTYVQPTVLSEDSDDSDSPKKKKKRKKGTMTGKKRVGQTKRTRVRTKAKRKIRRKVDDLSITMNVIVPISMDLTPFEVLVPALYTPFADPVGCPAATGGYKGCQQVTITLGPKQQFLQTGTDSSAAYPHALADAKAFYPQRTFVSVMC